MENEAITTQDEIQTVHRERELREDEPLYGLAPEAGGGGPASDHDPSQPRVEAPVEEPADESLYQGVNMTWGIILGGVLLLFITVAILYYGVGLSINSQPFTTYPLK